LSALPVDPETAHALLSDVAPAAWPRGRRVTKLTPVALPPGVKRQAPPASSDPARRTLLEAACLALVSAEVELNALDAKIGDGDTGSTFATAARALLAELDQLPLGEPALLCASIAARLEAAMGGSSGILLSIGFAAMGAALALPTTDPAGWPAALHEGARRIQQYGGAERGDRTLLDALLPAIAALEAGDGLPGAAAAARRGAELTATMVKARAGRSSYVPTEALRGVADPGAVAIAKVFDALRAASAEG
jgi:dihydroxyacetone kinase